MDRIGHPSHCAHCTGKAEARQRGCHNKQWDSHERCSLLAQEVSLRHLAVARLHALAPLDPPAHGYLLPALGLLFPIVACSSIGLAQNVLCHQFVGCIGLLGTAQSKHMSA